MSAKSILANNEIEADETEMTQDTPNDTNKNTQTAKSGNGNGGAPSHGKSSKRSDTRRLDGGERSAAFI